MNATLRSASPMLLLAASALALVAGCSSALPAGAASTSSLAPTVAFAASEADVTSPCAIVGVPQVIAAHVQPMAGVTAEVDGERVWLRFATKYNPRAAVALDPGSLLVEDEEDAAPAAPPPVAKKKIASGPVGVAIEGGRQLVAWTDGSTYFGMRVRAVTLAEGGDAVGAPIDLGFEGSAIGRPAVAVTTSGRGVLAFEESYGGGFHLVAAKVQCQAPVAR
ncbi:MAG TPA: hypothetical protein VGG39_17285 [Polyangiaceae bacterium]